jgi:hypothetical protein
MSPYVAFNDNPVFYIDPYGLEATNDGEPDEPKVQELGEVTVVGKRKYTSTDAADIDSDVPDKLPTDVGKGSTVNIRYSANKNDIRNDLFTYLGDDKWRRDRSTNGFDKPTSIIVTGNPKVKGFAALDGYLKPDLAYSNGGSQGGTCTTCGDKKGSGVETNSSTPTTVLMAADPTLNSPTPDNVQKAGVGDAYLSNLTLTTSAAAVVGDKKLNSGSYTQTNGEKGNFNNKPDKKLSQLGKSNKSFAKNLAKMGKVANALTVVIVVADVMDDGNIKASTAINTALTGLAVMVPITAPLILIYGIVDFTFGISGHIDRNYSGIDTGL